MNIIFHRNFKKSYKKLSASAKDKFDERLAIFAGDAYHPILRNHQLTGKYRQYRSIDITGDIRAIYESIDEETVVFIIIDTHSQLYG